MKILLAVDGSECSDTAAEEMAKRPWPSESEVEVFCAIEPASLPATETWVLPSDYYERIENAAEAQARSAVDKTATRLRDRVSQVITRVVRGYPKDAILDEAERWGADLIIMGSHGYRGFKKWWLGSVSHAVAMQAKCSVEIVRRAGARSLSGLAADSAIGSHSKAGANK